MALSLISWALGEGNTAGAKRAADTAKQQIEALKKSQGIIQQDLNTFLSHLPLTKVESIGNKRTRRKLTPLNFPAPDPLTGKED